MPKTTKSHNKQPHFARLAFAVSSLLCCFSSHSASLEDTITNTLATQPELNIIFSRYQAWETQIDQARAGWLPQVNASLGIGREMTNSPSTRRNGLYDSAEGRAYMNPGEAGLSLRQMLFDGLFTEAEVERTSHEATAEQWALIAAAEDMALSVAEVYLNVMRDQQIVELAEINLETHRDIYQQIKERTESGLGSTADFSQVTGRLARANANFIAARNNLLDSIAAYQHITGEQPEELSTPSPDLELLPESLEQLISLAQTEHPVLKSAAQDILAAKSEKKASTSAYYPNVHLEIGGNWNNDIGGEEGRSLAEGNNVGGFSNDLQAMVRMRYNLYAGGRDIARNEEAAFRIAESKEIRERAYRQVLEGASLAWNAYELLPVQKQYISEHVLAAKETQVAFLQQFSLGQRSLFDLLDTENEYFETKRDLLITEFTEIYAQYRVLNATGRLLESMEVMVPAQWQSDHQLKDGAF